jgi:hypothetical protein
MLLCMNLILLMEWTGILWQSCWPLCSCVDALRYSENLIYLFEIACITGRLGTLYSSFLVYIGSTDVCIKQHCSITRPENLFCLCLVCFREPCSFGNNFGVKENTGGASVTISGKLYFNQTLHSFCINTVIIIRIRKVWQQIKPHDTEM